MDYLLQRQLQRLCIPQPGLIHHSDRGIQYCSHEYGKLLKHLGIKPSMSGKGNCYDNAPMESFFGTLKNELIHHKRYATREDAIKDIPSRINETNEINQINEINHINDLGRQHE